MGKSIGNKILIEVGHLILPLESFDKKEEVAKFLNEIGFSIEPEKLNVDFKPLKKAIKLVRLVLEDIDSLKEEDKLIEKIKLLAEQLKPAIEEVKKAIPKLKANVEQIIEISQDSKDLLKELPKRAIDLIVYKFLEDFHPKTYAVIHLNGIAEEIVDKTSFAVKTINWSRLPKLLTKPHANFNITYKWTEDFNGEEFINRLENLLFAFSISGEVREQEEIISEQLGIFQESVKELSFPILQKGAYPNTYSELRLSLVPVPRDIEILVDISQFQSLEEEGDDYNPEDYIPLLKKGDYKILRKKGLLLYPAAIGNLKEEKDFGENWKLTIGGNLNLGAGLGLEFRPEEKIHLKKELFSDKAADIIEAHFDLDVRKSALSNEYLSIIGDADQKGTFLGYKDYGIAFKIGTHKGDFNLQTEIDVNQLTFVVDTEGGDGFIKKLLSNLKIESVSDIGIGFSNKEGFYFSGASGLDIHIPIHKSVGPVFLESSFLGLYFSDTPEMRFGMSFTAQLGPIYAAVDKIGLALPFNFPEDGTGNFGPVDMGGFKFIKPSGVDISLESPLIYGGGFIKHFPEEFTYAGALALNLRAIEIFGIGIITTKLPNNKPGFSLLISISVIFNPAIQLSFGFTLNGVGGLIGINRTLEVDVLRDRLASGAVNSIMFPTDPIKNADRIISDLRAVFPPKEKHFVIAPFLKIGYGTPTIIEVDLGVIIEIPFKGRIILLGSLGIYLPAKEKPLTQIIIDTIGDFNFAEQYIRVDGRLRDSHIMKIPLTGGFAFMLSWGKRPAFLFSIGGYHPRYKKPARFPEIPRLSALIKKGKSIVLTCDFYQAITSNSFQIGFAADLKIRYKGAEVDGFFGFNALIQFDPFYFDVDISLSVHVRYKGKKLAGIDLYFNLRGPAPWIVTGRAKIKILFIKLNIKFRKEWGEKRAEIPTYIRVEKLMKQAAKELSDQSNWTVRLPDNFQTAETLKPKEELQKEGLIIHPGGYLEVRQTAVPFNRKLEKYGNAYVREVKAIRISEDIKINEKPVEPKNYRYLKEDFARGQYEDLKDSEKLSTPDFEPMVAGLNFGNGDSADFDLGEDFFSMETFTDNDFENVVLQPDLTLDRKPTSIKHKVNTETRRRINRKSVRQNHANSLSKNCHCLMDTSPEVVEATHYQIVNVIDLSPITAEKLGIKNRFDTYAAAKELLYTTFEKEREAFQIIYAEAI